MKKPESAFLEQFKRWGDIGSKEFKNRVDAVFDSEAAALIGDDGKPVSCAACPFVVWYTDYKRCPLLRRQLHDKFRVDARLKECPVKVLGCRGNDE